MSQPPHARFSPSQPPDGSYQSCTDSSQAPPALQHHLQATNFNCKPSSIGDFAHLQQLHPLRHVSWPKPPDRPLQPPSFGNRFQHPPPGNMFHSKPSGNVLQQPPPTNMLQQPPPRNMLPQPPPRNVLRQPPPRNMLQQPPPRNVFQQPPPRNVLQQPPFRNVLQQPPPSNMLQQPPPRNVSQQPPSRNVLQQLPSRNVLQQLPPTNVLQQPPPSIAPHPPPRHMPHGPPPMRWPHPTNLSQPPPTAANFTEIAPPAQKRPRLGSMQQPPPLSCLAPPPVRPTSIPAVGHFPPSSADRLLPPPVHNERDIYSSFSVHSPGVKVLSSSAAGPPLNARGPVSKPFPGTKILSNISTSVDFLPCSSSAQLPEHGIKAISSANAIPNIPPPFCNITSFSGPPPSVIPKVGCSIPTNAYAASPHSSIPPPNISSGSNRKLSMGNFDSQAGNETLRSSSFSGIEIPRHPLNPSWVSCTKLQHLVDEWVSEKLKTGINADEQPSGPNNMPSRRGGRDLVDDSVKVKSSVIGHQGPEDLKKILEESGFHGSRIELLSSLLPLLNKEYKDFRLREVHSCVAAYQLLLEELRSCSGAAQRAQIKKFLDPIKCILSDPKFQELVRKLASARTKKRLRKKRRRVSLKEDWDRKGKQIDARREDLHRLEQQKLQETKLRAEVDTVLREVRGKQEEAGGLQTLLWTLQDLRQHRLNRGEQQGYVSDQPHDDRFSRVADGLEKMVESQLADYALEERTLQAMLQGSRPPAAADADAAGAVGAEATATQSEEAASEAPLVQELLFGTSAPVDCALHASYCAADTSLEMLVARRRAWDKHIVGNRDTGASSSTTPTPPEGGSGIPVCWVLPPALPALPWRQHLAS